MNSVTCPICGEFDAEDTSDAHDLCDILELESWNYDGFGVSYDGVVYTGEEVDVVAVELMDLGRVLIRLILSVAGAALLLGVWVAKKFVCKDRM